jgi:hypothetical protein
MTDKEIIWQEKDSEVVIDDSNFNQYFFDVRNHSPQRGQVIAKYTTAAYLVEGEEKRRLIDLLLDDGKIIAATNVMRKAFMANEGDSYRIPREIVEDLLSGMNKEQCMAKQYKFTAEICFYTMREYVPKHDPHWCIISILNLDDFLDKKDQRIKARIVKQPERTDDPHAFEEVK